mmetsp:Transcript_125971/g.364446  ORF Transcript_125971/g.364446 Transcript_125971/m.364446 type:complete len:106 (-) Transcript_125971:4813-5130(-)
MLEVPAMIIRNQILAETSDHVFRGEEEDEVDAIGIMEVFRAVLSGKEVSAVDVGDFRPAGVAHLLIFATMMHRPFEKKLRLSEVTRRRGIFHVLHHPFGMIGVGQ